MALIDLTGQIFGKLVVLTRVFPNHVHRTDGTRAQWLCLCECGESSIVIGKHLRSGNTTSCGCRKREALAECVRQSRTHGQSQTRLYYVWNSIKCRCYNPRTVAFHRYGGRGIGMDPEWKDSFASFYNYVRTELGERPSALHSLDRINNDGNYEPGNIRWATRLEQSHNQRPQKRRS